MRSYVVVPMLLAWSADAWAGCDAPYSLESLLADVQSVEESLRGGQDQVAGTTAAGLETKLPCLEKPLPAVFASRVLRAVGAGIYAGGNTARGAEWLLTAAESDPGFEYGVGDIVEGSPLMGAWVDALDQATSSDRQKVEGKVFGGTPYLDGKKLSSPEARPDRPHLFQLEGATSTQGWVIQGNGFPEEAWGTGKPTEKPKPGDKPKPGVKPTPGAKPKPKPGPKVTVDANGYQIVKQKSWPAERVILVASGGAVMIAGGVIYGLAGASNAQFKEAKTEEDLKNAWNRTNALAVAGVSTFAVGAGVSSFGVLFFLVDGKPITGFNVRF